MLLKVQNNQRAQNAVKQIYGPIYYYDNGVMKTIKFYISNVKIGGRTS